LLIVNADDWGLRPEVTDAIAECWSAGAITAASAMVGMADSERAFGLAARNGLPLGLHLNLTIGFDGVAAGAPARERQAQAAAYFSRPWRRSAYGPFVRKSVDLAIADQIQTFAMLGGGPPRHADGHQHIQTCPTVLLAPALRAVDSLREAHAEVGRRSALRGAYRGAVNRLVRTRFRSVPFYSLRDLHPALGGASLERLRALATAGDVEVMVHPAWEDERGVLLSDSWRQLLSELPTGSHDDLL
jgi:predicted glycoside hydrolase/deacetylase ChbG (UPF0249 family)